MFNIKKLVKSALVSALGLSFVLPAATNISAAEITNEPVELEVWLSPQWRGVYSADEEGADYDSFLVEAARLYNEQNPNVQIKVENVASDQRDSRLSVGLETDSLPNIFFDSTFVLTSWAHQGVALPLDDIISEESREDIQDTIWENVTIGDSVYFYPFAQSQGTLVYNADMFEEAGLGEYVAGENEIANWSVDEFTEILTKLDEAAVTTSPLGFFGLNEQGDTWNMMHLRTHGNPFFGEDGQLVVNEPSGVEALEYINQLDQAGLLVDGAESLSSNDVNALFQNREVAISFTNSVLYNNILIDMENGVVEPFSARLANYPTTDDATPPVFTYVLGSVVFDVLDETENAVAKDFVKFYSEHEDLINASINTLPVRDSVTEAHVDELPLLEAYNQNAENIVNFSNNMPNYSEFRSVFFPEIQAVLTGAKTPQEALDSLAQNGNGIIERGNQQSLILNQ